MTWPGNPPDSGNRRRRGSEAERRIGIGAVGGVTALSVVVGTLLFILLCFLIKIADLVHRLEALLHLRRDLLQ